MGPGSDPSGRTPRADLISLTIPALAGAYGSLDTMLNIAFPDLVDGLGLEVFDLQWIIVAYVLSYGGLLIGTGRLGDWSGHRRALRWGGAISAVGMVMCGAAPNLALLVGGRVAQGMGTALVMASAPALITGTVGQDRRGRALGLFQMSAAVGLAIGPLLGGPIVAGLGWRWVFWIRVPVGLVLVALAGWRLPPHSNEMRCPASVDPVVDAGLLRRPAFLIANLLNLVANGAAFVGWLFVPGFVVDELGAPVIVGGMVLAASPVATAVVAPLAGRWSDRYGAWAVATAGLVVQAVGLAVGMVLVRERSVLGLALALALVGAGLGLFTVPNMSSVMGSLPPGRQGVAGGVTLTMRTAGIVIGVVALSAVFDARLDNGFGPALSETFLVAMAATAGAAALSVGRGLRASGRS